jgi:hypothetical protein
MGMQTINGINSKIKKKISGETQAKRHEMKMAAKNIVAPSGGMTKGVGRININMPSWREREMKTRSYR